MLHRAEGDLEVMVRHMEEIIEVLTPMVSARDEQEKDVLKTMQGLEEN